MTHMVEMSEGTTGSVSWKKTLFKIFIVLVFPIGISINFDYGLEQWTSILFHVDYDGQLIFASLFTVLFAIILMLPGIFFERKIQLNPISSSIRRKALISIVAIGLLSFGFVFISIFNPYFYGIDAGVPIIFVPILTISLFIFLPIFNRELTIRSTPMNMQSLSFSFFSSIFKMRFGKLRFLPVLLWVGLLFSPIIIMYPWGDIWGLSILFQMRLYIATFMRDFPYLYGFYLNLTPLNNLPFVMLVFSLRFVFIRDIYRFNEGTIQKSRLISIGLLAEIVPVAVLTLLNLSALEFSQYFIPTPFFPLLGYLYVRYSKLPPMMDEIWEDEEHRMWFEDDKQPISLVQKPMEHRIKVPISYLIVSQFRKLRKH